MTLTEVIQGLKNGVGFKRLFNVGGEGAEECVRPTQDKKGFRHDVAGSSNGGWGGSNTLHIEVIDNGTWASQGWKLLTEEDEIRLAPYPAEW